MFIKNNRSGFTLVEIMIVVAIIALLAAVGIPSLLGARRSANEAAANANVKTLCSELEVYASGDGDGAYYASQADFINGSSSADNFCAASRGGYNYTCAVAAGAYTITATPISGSTGTVIYTGTEGGQITES